MVRLVDTNILLYAALPSAREIGKRRIALEILGSGDLALSTQVLQEFYYQATRPTRADALTSIEAMAFLEEIDSFPIQPITPELFREAVSLSERYQLSYWDAAILAAARAMDCDAVYSEDLSEQQDYAGLRVINPFAN